jgi:hypothetical protein
MVAAMFLMLVVAAMMVCSAVVMTAVAAAAIGTALSRESAVKCQRLPSQLQGVGP